MCELMLFLFLEHLQHAVRDHEAAEDVGRTENHRDEAERLRQRAVRVGQHQHAAEQDDAVNGVGAGHQRRVQHRRHFGDHFKAHEKSRGRK